MRKWGEKARSFDKRRNPLKGAQRDSEGGKVFRHLQSRAANSGQQKSVGWGTEG